MLRESLLPSAVPAKPSIWRRVQQELLLVSTACFLSVLCLINSASFGLLLTPASSGLPVASGVPIFLIASVVAQVALCFKSGVPFAAGGATIEIIPLLTPISSLVGDDSLEPVEKASTLLAMLSSCSLIVGAIYLAISSLRLGRVFRCIPLIVLKSALTGVGVFLVIESIKMGVDLREGEPVVPQLLGDGLPRLCSTVSLFLGLALVQRQTSSPFATLGYLCSAVVIVAALRAARVLVLSHDWYFGSEQAEESATSAASSSSPSPASPWAMFGLLPSFSLSSVHLSIVVSSLPYAFSAAFVHALCTVTDLVALESTANAAAEKQAKAAAARGAGGGAAGAAPAAFSLDREMGAIGAANLLAACAGAMPNYMQLTPSVVALRFTLGVPGSAGPYTALITAALLPLLDDIVAMVPRPVVAAFILEMGVGFVLDTGIDTMRHTSDHMDQALLVLVPTLMVALGFLQGLAAGLLLALVHFVILYSSLPIVRWQQTGGQLRSNTVRPMAHTDILDVRGHHNVSIVSLQGYLMFGSAPQLSEQVNDMLARRDACVSRHSQEPELHAPPWFIIVDLRACKGIDFGGAQELVKLAALVLGRGGELRLAQPSTRVAATIVAAAAGKLGPTFLTFEEELHRSESLILARHGGTELPSLEDLPVSSGISELIRAGFHKTSPGDHEAVVTALTQQSATAQRHAAAAAKLLDVGVIRHLEPGDAVWRPADAASFFVIVLSGHLRLWRQGHAIEHSVPGTIQGFLAMLEREDGATARDTSLISAEKSRVLIISSILTERFLSERSDVGVLLMRAFFTRSAIEIRHWVRNASVICVTSGTEVSSGTVGSEGEDGGNCSPRLPR